MGAVTFSLLWCHACENGYFSVERGCDIKSRSCVKVVEGGFPHISARGYIIISKVNIYY